MGIIKAFSGAIAGTLADQWKDIITADGFNELSAVVPGVRKSMDNGRGTNNYGSSNVITNGSKIYVPENTAAFIFSQSGIEDIITEPGGYEYTNGQESVFNGSGIKNAILKQAKERIGYGGITADSKTIAFINLREIRGIKFGTHGPQVYNDLFYGVDLEIFAYGTFSIQITNPERFIRNFVPANTTYYSFADATVREQMIAEFLQSFAVAVNSLSSKYRISQLPAQSNDIAQSIAEDAYNAGSWENRFGFKIAKVVIENIEFSDDSRELVKQYSASKMSWQVYDNVSQKAANISAQQKIAEGIKENGLGTGGGMLFGMNMAQGLNPQTAQATPSQSASSFDQQIEQVKKLKELFDAGILTEEEFNIKKKEIMGI